MKSKLVAIILIGGVTFGAISEPQAQCLYSLGPVKIEWTGYKFNEKTGVKGSFKEINISSPSTASSVDELLANSTFLINALSVDSGVELRDESLRNSFFKLMTSSYMKGFVESVDATSAKVSLHMNGVTKSVPFKVQKTKVEVIADGTIDVLDFMMKKSMEGINKKCFDQHKGKDGVSKTWSEVGLKISSGIIETCKPKK